MKVVIVGGVAGGATAAARIRRLDEQAEIIIFERTGYVSYATCGLPYYIGGVIEDGSQLTLQTPQSFARRFNIDVRVRHEVLQVLPAQKQVLVKNLESGEEHYESYDKLLLSPGAKPFVPPVNGLVSCSNVFVLRTVEDAESIRSFVMENKPASAVVVGGGFIGLEMAENLKEMGLDVSVAELAPQVLPQLDSDMASLVQGVLRRNGVHLMLNNGLAKASMEGERIHLVYSDGAEGVADMLILAAGVQPDSALAVQAGLALGVRGSILADDMMRTSAEDVFAVGDAVQIKNSVSGQDALISLAGPANKQARIAADNICGMQSHYRGAQGSSILKLFDYTVAATGLSETAAKQQGTQTEKVILSPMSHAGYYPGGAAMTMKVVFDKNTLRLLGAQIVGKNGVDKRIDVLATAIYAGMDVRQLAELDLAYAPPYSSAKDPVNMAGFIADNLARGIVKQFYYDDVASLQQRTDVTLLDTRTAAEYARGHAEGFINIPVDELRARIGELDRNKPVYVMCQSGVRSYIASRILTGHGFDTYNFTGGYSFYVMTENY